MLFTVTQKIHFAQKLELNREHFRAIIDGMVNSNEVEIHSKTKSKSVVVPETFDTMRQLILQDRHVTYREIETSEWNKHTVDRKILRKIFGPVRVSDDFRIRAYSELYEFFNDLNVVQRIIIQRLRWLGHVVRMVEDAPARRVFDIGICGSRRSERPCICWKNKIEEALSSIGVTN